jgi:hypothetical protein
MRHTLKAVNAELARRGHTALLAKGAGYFYFSSGEAAEWLDRTVNVPTLSSLSLNDWLAEFDRLKKLNSEIMKAPKKPASQGKQPKRGADSSEGNT